MMAWLLDLGTDWGFKISGGSLLCSTGRRQPWELEPLLEAVRSFRSRIPSVVDELFGGETSTA